MRGVIIVMLSVAAGVARADLAGDVTRCLRGNGQACLAVGDAYRFGQTLLGATLDRRRGAEFYERACTSDQHIGCPALLETVRLTRPPDLRFYVHAGEHACRAGWLPGCVMLAELYDQGQLGATREKGRARAYCWSTCQTAIGFGERTPASQLAAAAWSCRRLSQIYASGGDGVIATAVVSGRLGNLAQLLDQERRDAEEGAASGNREERRAAIRSLVAALAAVP